MPKTTTKGAHAGKRHPLNMRTTKETRERLEAAAIANGRSLAQEVEVRLERSFDRQELLSEAMSLAYGPRLAGLLMRLGAVMQTAGRHAALLLPPSDRLAAVNNWIEHPFSYAQAVKGAISILEAARPAGEPTLPRDNPIVLSVAALPNLVQKDLFGASANVTEELGESIKTTTNEIGSAVAAAMIAKSRRQQ